MISIEKTNLLQGWIHSHEEDSGETMVFRPESHPFPPSRGRYGFTLKPGGVMTGSGPSAADVPLSNNIGSWSVSVEDLFLKGSGEGRRHYKIEAVSKDKLVLRQVK